MKSLMFVLLSLFSFSAFAEPAAPSLVGKWIVHVYVQGKDGKATVFDDILVVRDGAKGLEGEIEVPGLFKANLRTIRVSGSSVYFDIEAVEKGKTIEMKYEGQFHSGGDTFVGFASFIKGDRLLGGFVGRRVSTDTKPPVPFTVKGYSKHAYSDAKEGAQARADGYCKGLKATRVSEWRAWHTIEYVTTPACMPSDHYECPKDPVTMLYAEASFVCPV